MPATSTGWVTVFSLTFGPIACSVSCATGAGAAGLTTKKGALFTVGVTCLTIGRTTVSTRVGTKATGLFAQEHNSYISTETQQRMLRVLNTTYGPQ